MSAPEVIADGKYALFSGMTWPTPMDELDGGLEWRLRYAHPEQVVKDRYLAASIISAYRELITCPRKKREAVIRELRRAITSCAGRP